jgi:hypothetical protein
MTVPVQQINDGSYLVAGILETWTVGAKRLKKWRTRYASNVRPMPSEGSGITLSLMLSSFLAVAKA